MPDTRFLDSSQIAGSVPVMTSKGISEIAAGGQLASRAQVELTEDQLSWLRAVWQCVEYSLPFGPSITSLAWADMRLDLIQRLTEAYEEIQS
jgi:hypothetical protein